MGIGIEESNGGETIRISKDIIIDLVKEILDEKHECMWRFCLDYHSKVIFDRSINQKYMSQEKKALIEKLND